jgi:amicyanin
VKTHNRLIDLRPGWRSAAMGAALVGVLAAPAWAAGPHHDGPDNLRMARIVTAATGSPADARIEIAKHKFSLPTVTVPVGGTVTWMNHDEDVHTVVSTTQVFRSPGLDTDEAYSYKFTKPGVYQYFCTLHPLMTGTVIVK